MYRTSSIEQATRRNPISNHKLKKTFEIIVRKMIWHLPHDQMSKLRMSDYQQRCDTLRTIWKRFIQSIYAKHKIKHMNDEYFLKYHWMFQFDCLLHVLLFSSFLFRNVSTSQSMHYWLFCFSLVGHFYCV